MKNIVKSVLGGAALLGLSMAGTAQAEPDYLYSATAFVGGGGTWLSNDNNFGPFGDRDIATIVGGGDFVLPLRGYWNVQLGGAFHTGHEHFFFGSDSTTQFQGSAIGFWRDPAMGVFGIEVGAFSPFGDDRGGFFNSAKVGGVVEYFFSDMITFGAFGGVLLPFDPSFRGSEFDTSFYAGGHVTYYTSENLAFAGFARFTELNSSIRGNGPEFADRSLTLGGKVRYLTSMPGVELYASGAYHKCENEFSFQGNTNTNFEDGAQVMAGVNVRLGGHTDSLANIDRSNAIDTRAWACDQGGIRRISDRRLKTDIAALSETADGIQLYSWKYLNDPVTTWVGVMAQDLAASHPEALSVAADGYYRVNYSFIDAQMMTLEQWNARQL